jgi:hypothetical protein
MSTMLFVRPAQANGAASGLQRVYGKHSADFQRRAAEV